MSIQKFNRKELTQRQKELVNNHIVMSCPEFALIEPSMLLLDIVFLTNDPDPDSDDPIVAQMYFMRNFKHGEASWTDVTYYYIRCEFNWFVFRLDEMQDVVDTLEALKLYMQNRYPKEAKGKAA